MNDGADELQEREERVDEVIAEYLRADDERAAPDEAAFIAGHLEFAVELADFFAARKKLQAIATPPQADCPTTVGFGQTPPPSERHPAIDAPGRRFGDYELIEEIARGGMGVVFKARQTSLNRIVAVKMILSGHLASVEEVDRFYFEAQAAASLKHPNLVGIYEVGKHEGQHYFSMDYIEGQSLAEILQDGPLSAERAARYVQTISEATHFAHERGILHRDLKPSNVLIDAADQPRITDFGLAKQLDAGPELTGTGQILGTPSYMAPEQCRGKQEGEPLGPTADVYSLGAILYACLAGRPPFQAADVMETLKQVLEKEPVPLRQFNAKLSRDLETICLKCLEKDPKKRYPTAVELADDLGRFQAGEPILARPIGPAGRIVKWARRRPAAAGLVAVSVLFSIALVGTLSASNMLISRKQAETQHALGLEKVARSDAELARHAARREAELALATLRSNIYEIDSKLKEMPAVHALRRGLLDNAMQGLQKISADLAGDMRVDSSQVKVHWELGNLFWRIGNSDGLGGVEKAKKEYEAALSIAQKAAAANSGDLQAQRDVATSYFELGKFMREQHDLAAANTNLTGSLVIRRRLAQHDPQNLEMQEELAAVYDWMGAVNIRMGDVVATRKLYEESLAIARRLAEAQPENVKFQRVLAKCYASIGELCESEADLAGARRNHEEAFAIFHRLAEANPSDSGAQRDLADTNYWLGIVCKGEGNLPNAEKYLEQSLQILERLTAIDPNDKLVQADVRDSLNELGKVSAQVGKQAEATKFLMRAFEISRRLVDADPQDGTAQIVLAQIHGHLGDALVTQEDLGGARLHFEQCFETCLRLARSEPMNGSLQLALVDAHVRLGRVSLGQGDLTVARRQFQQGLDVSRNLADAHPKNSRYLDQLGTVYDSLGRVSLAQRKFTAARNFTELSIEVSRRLAAADPNNAQNRYNLSVSHASRAQTLEAVGDYRAAIAEWSEAAEVLKPLITAGKLGNPAQKDLKSIESSLALLRKAQRAIDDPAFLSAAPEKDRPILLYFRAIGLAESGEMAEAAKAADMLRDFKPQTNGTLYDAACAYSRCGWAVDQWEGEQSLSADDEAVRQKFIAQALETLAEAVKLGYKSVGHVKTDIDLINLRKLPEFQAIVQHLEAAQSKTP